MHASKTTIEYRPSSLIVWLVLGILGILLTAAGPTTQPDSKGSTRKSSAGLTFDDSPLPLNFDFPSGQNEIVIPLLRGRDSWYVEASVNGQVVGLMNIDTGSAITAIDRDVVTKLKLKAIGKRTINRIDKDVETEVVLPDSIDVGPLHVNHPRVSAMDTSEGIGATGVRVAGLLGCDVFAQTPFTLDTREGKLILHRRETFAPPTDATEYLLRGDKIPVVVANFGGRAGGFGIDTGYAGSILVFCEWSRQQYDLFEHPYLHDKGAWTDTGNYHYFEPSPAMEALGLQLPHRLIAVQVKAQHHDWVAGLIGASCLIDLRLTFDMQNHRCWRADLPPDPLDAYLARIGDIDSTDLAGQSPLIRAIWQHRADAAHALVAAHARVDHSDDRGITAVHLAAAKNDIALLSELIQAGANLESRGKYEGQTPLYFTAIYDAPDAARLLVEHGVKVDVKTDDGRTPLFVAAQLDRPNVVKVFLDHGAKVDEALQTGETPLIAACSFGNANCVELLLQRGVNPNITGKLGTPLTYACNHCSADCARLLLAARAKIEQHDSIGFTPLMIAADRGDGARCVDLLLKAGADPNATAEGTNTRALDCAMRDGSPASIELLRRVTKR